MDQYPKINNLLKNEENSDIINLGEGYQESFPERILLFEIITRAIKDVSFLFSEDTTPEQKAYGRSALTWLFMERVENIKFLYPHLPSQNVQIIQFTSFDNICSWLELDAEYIRKKVINQYSMEYMSIFV